MSNYFLFEIGVEELPSRFVNSTLEQIKQNTEKMLKEQRVNFKEIKTYQTPRRLTFVIDEIDLKQQDLKEELKGPSKKISLDENGNFTKPALGFMKSKGLKEEDITFKTIGKDEYLFATINKEGIDTKEVLKEILPKAIKNTTFPKAMRWGGKNMRFVRPIRWLLALLNDEVVEVNLEGIIASNVTCGHRFLGQKQIVVNSLDDYFTKLEENFVLIDNKKRKELIKNQCIEVANNLGGQVELDEDLLDEVTNLVEYPTAFYGEFDKSYVNLPKEVVTTPMKEHQRYFPVVKDGKLLPNFIAVRNGNDFEIENVKKGNEKVLVARLEDALFFYKEDVKKKLEEYTDKLKNVVFQAKLGTIFDKTLRIEKLSTEILNLLDMQNEVENAKRASKLCKSDLVTNMVFEFTELQGIMGREYAKVSGENEEVCEAIFEHYLPRFAGDILPQTNCGIALALADKLDSICGFFAINICPTGSQDPYALRRQALGVLNIIINKNLNIDLEKLVRVSLENYSNLEFNKEEVTSSVMEFFKERLKNLFKDLNIRYDVVDAVLSSNLNNVYDTKKKADELNSWLDKDELVEILTAFNRVSTLAQKATSTNVDKSLLKEESEKVLYDKFVEVDKKVAELLAKKEYKNALDEFLTLRESIDNMFDNVMIMDKDENVKNNRLSLLNQIYKSMLSICDLSKIVYK